MDPEEPTGPTSDPAQAPCEWAADLVQRLAASGTGEDKLRPLRDAMHARFESRGDFPPDHPARHLTAAEGVAALEAAGVPALTIDKARAFARVGVYSPPPAPLTHPAELLPPPPRGQAPAARTRVQEPEATPDMPPARPEERRPPTPGPIEPAADDVPVTGPKPTQHPQHAQHRGDRKKS